MELANKLIKELNNPALGFNKADNVTIVRILKTLNINTMDQLKTYYGDNYHKGLRADYCDCQLWKTKEWLCLN